MLEAVEVNRQTTPPILAGGGRGGEIYECETVRGRPIINILPHPPVSTFCSPYFVQQYNYVDAELK